LRDESDTLTVVPVLVVALVLACSYGWWKSQIGVYEIDAKPLPFRPPFQGALALALPRPEGLGCSF
jgi:hypothetical protein